MSKTVIDELNTFLQGRYMGIHQYEHLIEHTSSAQLKEELQRQQLATKRQAERVATRIQQLDGIAAHDVGFIGIMQEWMKKIKGYPQDTESILRDAIYGEQKYAIHLSHHMVAGDLDEESTHLIEEIIAEDKEHLQRLQQLFTSLVTHA